MSVQKTVTMEELLDIGKALFFPNGKSAKGPLKDFKFDVGDFMARFHYSAEPGLRGL